MKRNRCKIVSFVLIFSMLLSSITVNAVDTTENLTASNAAMVEAYGTMELDVDNLVTIEEEKQEVYLKFVPEESGTYRFYSEANADTCGTLYDSEFQEIQSDDDSGGDLNFAIVCELTQNQTYYLGSRFLNDADLGSFYVYVTEINIPEITVGINIEETVDENVLYKFIPEEDGSFKFTISYDDYEYSSYAITLYDSNYHYIASGENNKITYFFKTGEVYYFEIAIMNKVDLKVSLEKVLGISQLEILSLPDRMTYYKDGIKSLYDYDFDGLQLKATMDDGSIVYWTYYEGDLGEHSVSIDAYYNETTEEDSDIVISCAGKSAEFSFVIIENPVESIELVAGTVPELVENVGGWWEGEYFYYTDLDTSNLQFRINYKDGTSKIVQIYDVVDGYTVFLNETQWEIPWTIGNNNYLEIEYAGKTVSVPVTIVENPVERIELNSVPTKEYIWGDVEFGYMDEDGTYSLYPSDMTGFSFTVYYKDGSFKTFTDADINENGRVDGYHYTLELETYPTKIGEIPVVFRYMNHTVEYVVKVVESTVVRIEVIEDPNVTEYDERYAPDFIGMQVRVFYDDGSSKDVAFTESDTIYEPEGGAVEDLCYSIGVEGHLLEISPAYDEKDGGYYLISYLGAICSYKGIEFYEGKKISTIESTDLSLTGEDMSINITYVDDTTQELLLEFVNIEWEKEDEISGYTRTANGMMYCYISAEKEDEQIINYDMHCLNGSWKISIQPRKPEEYLCYEIVDGEITIIGCNESATGKIVIPETIEGLPVTKIGQGAFHNCTSLISVTMEDGVESIGEYAFSGCNALETVAIPKSVKNIDYAAFQECENLKEVYINDIVAWCSIEFEYLYSNPLSYGGAKLFIDKTLAVDIVIPDGVTRIGTGAFNSYSNLTSVTIPDSVASVGKYAFYNCENLQRVYIDDVASWCNIKFEDTYASPLGASVSGNSQAELFVDGKLLEGNITIPNGVTGIGHSAFQGCSGLTSVTIPDGVTSIGHSAFRGCSGLTTVAIPDSVTSMGNAAFYGCENMKEVYIDDVASWCNIEFGIWDWLYASPLSNGVEKLFVGGKLVEDVVIPDGVTSINAGAFQGYSGLLSVTIPDSITSIGSAAFENCENLREVYTTDIASWCNIEFADNKANPLANSSVRLIVNGELLEGDITIPNGVTSIGHSAFQGCSGLTSVTIPDGVISIGYSAFSGCSGLTSVTIPDSVTSVGAYAFENCTSLISVTIPTGVKTIECWTFGNCIELISLVIPSSVEFVEYCAVQDCNNLKTIYYTGNKSEWNDIANNDILLETGDYGEEVEVVYDYVALVKNDVEIAATKAEVGADVVLVVNVIKSDSAMKDDIENGAGNFLINDCVLYDICLMKDEQKTQPNGEITVSIRVPDGLEGNSCKVFYIDDSGEIIDMRAVYQNGYMVFQTDHFSYYALVELLKGLLGDFDDTGLVDSDDAIHLLCNTLFGEDMYPLNQSADVNGDGVVDSDDAVYLLCHTLFGEDLYPLN